MELTLYQIHDFVSGPCVWLSIVLFLAGTIYQINQFFRLSKHKTSVSGSYKQQSRSLKDMIISLTHSCKQCLQMVKRESLKNNISFIKTRTIYGVNPFMSIVTTIFHICLVLVPMLTFAHNILIEESLGIRFFSLSDMMIDMLTACVIICGIIFVLRRLLSDRVRSITTPYDYVILCLAMLPFVTGFLAYHQLFNYQIMVIAHMISGELMLIAIPYTKLVHMIYFFLNRCFIGSEYSFGKGSRYWRLAV